MKRLTFKKVLLVLLGFSILGGALGFLVAKGVDHYKTNEQLNHWFLQLKESPNDPKIAYTEGFRLISASEDPPMCHAGLEAFYDDVRHLHNREDVQSTFDMHKTSLMRDCRPLSEVPAVTQREKIAKFQSDFLSMGPAVNRAKTVRDTYIEGMRLVGTAKKPFECNISVQVMWKAIEAKEMGLGDIVDGTKDYLATDCI